MPKYTVVRSAVLALLTFGVIVPWLTAQTSSLTGAPVRMIVTAEPQHGSSLSVINRDDVLVSEGHNRDHVTDWIPLQGSHAGMELFILIDDSLSTSEGTYLSDIRNFMSAQPATTALGVGYMRNGTVIVAQNPSTDHAQAEKALRLPIGDRGVSPSPYLSITDLLKRWPDQPVRREILMITSGADGLNGGGPTNPYLDQAIAASQKAGIVVYSIYAPGAGHLGHSFWRVNWGQNYLSQLSDETGGESYGLLLGRPVSYAPYLKDLSQKLNNQYLLTFIPRPEKEPEERKVKITTEVPNADLVAADQVYVP